MAKKKKFGIMDAVDLAQSAAQAFGTFKAAQKTTNEFDKGTATDLKGAEGGVSKKPTNPQRKPSQLNTDLIEKYRY